MADGRVVIEIAADASSYKSSLGALGQTTQSSLKNAISGSFIGNVLANAFSKATGAIASSIDSAISRVDTLNQFPKVMQSIGFGADEAEAAINKLSDGIQGLPTTLDTVASSAQSIALLTGDLDTATDTALALNDAFLASGSNSADAARGLQQYTQMLSKGKVDSQAWYTLNETMGSSLTRVAQKLGYTSTTVGGDLYTALQNGTLSFSDFNAALVECDQEAGGFADSALTASAGIGTSMSIMKAAVTSNIAKVIDAFADSGVITQFALDFKNLANNIGNALTPIAQKAAEVAKQIEPVLFSFLNSAQGAAAAVGVALAGLAAHIAPVISSFSGFKGIATLFGGLSAPILAVVAAVALLASGVAYAWQTNEQFRNTVTQLIAVIGSELMNALTSVSAIVQQFAAEMMPLIVSAVQQLAPVIAQVVTVLLQLVSAVLPVATDLLTAILPVLLQLVSAVLPVVLQVIQAILPLIAQVISVVSQLAQAVIPVVVTAVQTVMGVIQTLMPIIQTMLTVVAAVISGIIGFVAQVVSAVSSAVSSVADFISSIISAARDLFNSVSSTLSSIVSTIVNIISTIVSSVAGFISTVVSSIGGGLSGILGSVANYAGQILGKVANSLSGIIGKVASFVSQMASKAIQAGQQFASNLISKIQSLPSRVTSIGRNIVQGIANGIRNAPGAVANALQNVVNSAINRVKSFLGIHSPSKLMKTLIGENMAKGIGVGLEAQESSLAETAAGVIGNVADAMSGSTATLGANLDVSAASATLAANVNSTSLFGEAFTNGITAVTTRLDAVISRMETIAEKMDRATTIEINKREFARLLKEV